ncbi:unnamed protein product [Trichogramma brassicae]|uniref:Uncharacterized protein n=1 Tax=Trichogramma brassicae TaxID=86971 RepID=A0A6H5J544_9HYME|nr:unnamed protein product [Trichogramma brassicae]
MKPITGGTVLSIIHGPATTSHLREMSEFLRRPIDVWTDDGRLMLIGKSYRSSCRLSLAHKKIGHFTLVEGSEPRNPDAGCHPQDCAFDAISDQTGYPASLLRQVVAQRMLLKLYRSRLRGRDGGDDDPLDCCSSCELRGGMNNDEAYSGRYEGMYVMDEERAKELVELSKQFNGRTHAYVYKTRDQCKCSVYPNPTVEMVDCIKGYVRSRQRWKKRACYACFDSDADLYEILALAMNSEQGQNADYCLLDPRHGVRDVWYKKECCNFKTGYYKFEEDVMALDKWGWDFFPLTGMARRFRIGRVELTLKNPIERQFGESPLRIWENYYLKEMVPYKPGECLRI